jgi:cob(I)alamin adenosyltransferase
MVKLNKIYTRTGDDGTTGLVDGSRTAKSSALMAAIGDVDEANSMIGFAIRALDSSAIIAELTRIQNDLFDLGADLATPGASDGDGEPFAPSPMALRIISVQVERLEGEIDAMNANIPPLTSFILPGGSEGAARLHLARTATRRAERSAVAANFENALNPLALAYLNRLSDWLFVACRAANGNGADDILWVPGGSR